MKKYAHLTDNTVTEIIDEFNVSFPNVPISERYSEEYTNNLIEIPQGVECECFYTYDKSTGAFARPTVTPQETYIGTIEANKLSEINTTAENSITGGIDVGECHYSLTTHDQTNLITLGSQALQGKTVPYHADGEKCRFYTAEEFLQIYATAMYHITYHTTYANLLKTEVNAMTNADTIQNVTYGQDLNTEDTALLNQILGALSNDSD